MTLPSGRSHKSQAGEHCSCCCRWQPPGSGGVDFPAAYPGVVAAAGTDETGKHSVSSTLGVQVALAAPSTNIVSTYLHNGYSTATGTSASARSSPELRHSTLQVPQPLRCRSRSSPRSDRHRQGPARPRRRVRLRRTQHHRRPHGDSSTVDRVTDSHDRQLPIADVDGLGTEESGLHSVAAAGCRRRRAHRSLRRLDSRRRGSRN